MASITPNATATKPIYAVLGATGNTGMSLIRNLTKDSERQIHAYCRSPDKLNKLLPEIAGNPDVRIFAGSLDDQKLLADCFRGTRAVFLAVAVNDNIPGNNIAADTAKAVIGALEQIRDEPTTTTVKPKLPKLIILSASPLEPKFVSHYPAFLLFLIRRALSNIYGDLAVAEEYLRSCESWVSMVFIKPGALTVDQQRGHVLSTEESTSPISFMDLAAGMIEVADDEGGRFEFRNVSVNPTTKDVKFPLGNAKHLLMGLVYHYFPFLYGRI